jgi:hypothetical protein
VCDVQAINDKNAIVSSSALVSGLAFFNTSPDVVKRWNNEVNTLHMLFCMNVTTYKMYFGSDITVVHDIICAFMIG